MSPEFIAMKVRHARKEKKWKEDQYRKATPELKLELERIAKLKLDMEYMLATYATKLIMIGHGREVMKRGWRERALESHLLSKEQEAAIRRIELERHKRGQKGIWSDEV